MGMPIRGAGETAAGTVAIGQQVAARFEADNELLDDMVWTNGEVALAILAGESVAKGDSCCRWWIAGCGLSVGLAMCALIGWALALEGSVATAFGTR